MYLHFWCLQWQPHLLRSAGHQEHPNGVGLSLERGRLSLFILTVIADLALKDSHGMSMGMAIAADASCQLTKPARRSWRSKAKGVW